MPERSAVEPTAATLNTPLLDLLARLGQIGVLSPFAMNHRMGD